MKQNLIRILAIILVILAASFCARQAPELEGVFENADETKALSGYSLEQAYFIGAYFSVGAYDNRYDVLTKKPNAKNSALAVQMINSLKKHGWTIKNFEAKGKVGKDWFTLDSQYLLGKKTENGKNIYVVAFRGSELNTSDWLGSDFDAKGVKFLNTSTKVHKGFYQYATPAYENQVLKDMAKTVKNDAKAQIIVTGHSLGGAGALIYSAMLVEMGIPKSKINCVTFGQPAVGLRFFGFETRYKNQFNTYVRFVRTGDAVIVAASALYTHFGTKIQENGSINPVEAHDYSKYLLMAKKYAVNYARNYGTN